MESLIVLLVACVFYVGLELLDLLISRPFPCDGCELQRGCIIDQCLVLRRYAYHRRRRNRFLAWWRRLFFLPSISNLWSSSGKCWSGMLRNLFGRRS